MAQIAATLSQGLADENPCHSRDSFPSGLDLIAGLAMETYFLEWVEPALFRQNNRGIVGSGTYSSRKLPRPKCVTEIPAPRELLRLIAASLPLARVGEYRRQRDGGTGCYREAFEAWVIASIAMIRSANEGWARRGA